MNSDADELMCEVLIDFGYAAGIQVFREMVARRKRQVDCIKEEQNV